MKYCRNESPLPITQVACPDVNQEMNGEVEGEGEWKSEF